MTAGQPHAQPPALAGLAVALRDAASEDAGTLGTRPFVAACSAILPFFDHLGPVFHVARVEFQAKLDSLKQQCDCKPRLADIVDADRRAKTATVKNSATRNLHRLAAAILFCKLLFERLLDTAAAAAAADGAAAGGGGGGSVATLREAASAAYEAALAPFHTTIIKGVVRAGMLTLPSREQFLASIGESEASATSHAQEVVAACAAVHAAVTELLQGIDMPASSVWLWPSA